jgi:hypothetical protein
MNVIFERKIRRIGPERLLNIPEEIQDFAAGDMVKIIVEENGISIRKT